MQHQKEKKETKREGAGAKNDKERKKVCDGLNLACVQFDLRI